MVSILKRLHYISHAQVQHRIDTMEDPNIMLSQVVRDLSENIRDAKVQLVKAMSGQKQLKFQYDVHANSFNSYYAKAQDALYEEQEEIARKAMTISLDHQKIVSELEPALERADKSIENIKNYLSDLENKREIARRNHRLLTLRHNLAKAEITSNQFIDCQIQDLDTDELLRRMQEKVIKTESISASMVEMSEDNLNSERSIVKYEAQKNVDRELKKLKFKMNGNNDE